MREKAAKLGGLGVKAKEQMAAVGKKTANQGDSKHEHTDMRHLLNHEVCKGSVGKRNGRG
jgi:hypothetical protein